MSPHQLLLPAFTWSAPKGQLRTLPTCSIAGSHLRAGGRDPPDRNNKVVGTLKLDVLDRQIQTIRSLNPDKLKHLGPVMDGNHFTQRVGASARRTPLREVTAGWHYHSDRWPGGQFFSYSIDGQLPDLAHRRSTRPRSVAAPMSARPVFTPWLCQLPASRPADASRR